MLGRAIISSPDIETNGLRVAEFHWWQCPNLLQLDSTLTAVNVQDNGLVVGSGVIPGVAHSTAGCETISIVARRRPRITSRLSLPTCRILLSARSTTKYTFWKKLRVLSVRFLIW